MIDSICLSKPGIILLVFVLGCGKGGEPRPELAPVTGTVLLDAKPLANADVDFSPIGSTAGVGGQTRTNESGKFIVTYGHGGNGLPVGEYRVTISRRLMPDGSPVPPDDETPPIESPASESLPEKYHTNSELTEKVTKEGPNDFTFELKSE